MNYCMHPIDKIFVQTIEYTTKSRYFQNMHTSGHNFQTQKYHVKHGDAPCKCIDDWTSESYECTENHVDALKDMMSSNRKN